MGGFGTGWWRGGTAPGFGGGNLSLKNYGPNAPMYVAHRGGSWVYPEETMEGYREALEVGIRVLEMDVQVLTDGGLAVIHDDTVDAVTTGTGNVSALDTAGWLALRIDANTWHGSNFGNALVPPLFPALLSEFKGRAILLPEAKSAGSGAALVAALVAADIPKTQCIVQASALADLSAAVAAGYPACYLTAVSTDIAAAQAAGVTWVGVDQAAADAVFTAWRDAGFKVMAYTPARRWQRDRLLALGVMGFFTDDPQYMQANLPLATTDNFAAQTWMPGMQPGNNAYTELERGRFASPDYWGWSVTGSAWVLQGWACPIKGNATADSYTIDLKVTFDSGTGWASIFIAQNDKAFKDSGTPNSADTVGYHCLMRQNGTVQIYDRNASSTVSLVSQTGTTITAGVEVGFRLTVTPSSITLARLNGDGSVNYSTTTNDTSRRCGYFHLGRSSLVCRFRDVTVS